MEPSPLNVNPTGTKTQWAKPQDWEKYRNTITALFMCHSLPVVMRVMREEHHFHATPKMFQSQIYQKWGLRKTKPGEAKKEAKERKRRRQASEDVQSSGVDSHTREAEPLDNPSVGSGSVESTSPNIAAHQQAPLESTQFESSFQAGDFVAAPEASGVNPPNTQQQTRKPNYVVPEIQGAVPKGWQDFLSQSQLQYPLPLHSQLAPSSHVLDFQGDNNQYHSSEATPSAKTQSIRSDIRSRRATPSTPGHHAGLAPPSFKRAKYMAAIANPMGTLRSLESDPASLIPERSMFYARHFISSTYATGVWAWAQTDKLTFDVENARLEHWYNGFNPSFDCLRHKKVKKAFRILKRCFANTKDVLEPQDPRCVIYMCQQTIRCMFYDTLGRNLAQTLLRYISGLCQVIFGVHHPLYIMFNQLSCLDSFAFAQLIRPFMDCYFDHVEPFLEDSNSALGDLYEMRGLTVSLMEGTGMMGIYEAKPVLDRLVGLAQTKGLATIHLKVEMASLLSRNRFYYEALDILEGIRASVEPTESPYELTYAGIILIMTLQRMKDLDRAINVGYELSEFLSKPASAMPGYPNNLSSSMSQYLESRESSLLLVLGKLEKVLRDAERIEEADKVQKRIDDGVTEEYGVEGEEDPEASVMGAPPGSGS